MNMRLTKLVQVCAALAAVATVAGCSTPNHSENKQAALDRWTAARTGVTYSVAMQQFDTGDLDKAERTIRQALEVDPDNARFNVLAARVALEKGELERAYRHLELAISADAESADAHYLTGVVLQRWAQFDRALAAYEKAFESDPENEAGLIAVGEMLVKLGRPDEAISRLSEKLVYFEHNAALRMSIGRIHLKERRIGKAVEMFQEAYLLAPEDMMVLEQLALAEYAAGRFSEAIFHLKRVMEDQETAKRRDLQSALADCYQMTDRPLKARKIYLSLVRQDETDVAMWIKLGQAAYIVGDELRLEEAARAVTSMAPNRAEGHLLAGMAAQRAGHADRAVAAFEKALRLDGKNVTAWLMKGLALEQAERFAAAADAYAAALKVAPDNQRARQLLAGLAPSRLGR